MPSVRLVFTRAGYAKLLVDHSRLFGTPFSQAGVKDVFAAYLRFAQNSCRVPRVFVRQPTRGLVLRCVPVSSFASDLSPVGRIPRAGPYPLLARQFHPEPEWNPTHWSPFRSPDFLRPGFVVSLAREAAVHGGLHARTMINACLRPADPYCRKTSPVFRDHVACTASEGPVCRGYGLMTLENKSDA
jgi:hypothetical protein